HRLIRLSGVDVGVEVGVGGGVFGHRHSSRAISGTGQDAARESNPRGEFGAPPSPGQRQFSTGSFIGCSFRSINMTVTNSSGTPTRMADAVSMKRLLSVRFDTHSDPPPTHRPLAQLGHQAAEHE